MAVFIFFKELPLSWGGMDNGKVSLLIKPMQQDKETSQGIECLMTSEHRKLCRKMTLPAKATPVQMLISSVQLSDHKPVNLGLKINLKMKDNASPSRTRKFYNMKGIGPIYHVSVGMRRLFF